MQISYFIRHIKTGEIRAVWFRGISGILYLSSGEEISPYLARNWLRISTPQNKAETPTVQTN